MKRLPSYKYFLLSNSNKSFEIELLNKTKLFVYPWANDILFVRPFMVNF